MNIPETGGFTLLPDQHAILPFGIMLGDQQLIYATSQLLTRGREANSEFYVFFSVPGIEPEYSFAASEGLEIQEGPGMKVSKNRNRILVRCNSGDPIEFIIRDAEGSEVRILTIPLDMAENSYPLKIAGEDYLAFSTALVLAGDNSIDLLSMENSYADLSIYPSNKLFPRTSIGRITRAEDGPELFTTFRIQWSEFDVKPELKQVQTNKFSLTLPDKLPSHIHDLTLKIDYLGDTGMGFLDGELVLDQFYNGKPWHIGLRKFIHQSANEELVFYFRPLYEGAPFLNDLQSAGIEIEESLKVGFELKGMKITPEYKTSIIF